MTYYNCGEARALARAARKMRGGREVLFHGTRAPFSVLRKRTLLSSTIANNCVSFTRSADVAGYWGTLPRAEADEEVGAIFVFDRPKLNSVYRLHLVDEFYSGQGLEVEMEEVVFGQHVVNFDRFFIGVVSISKVPLLAIAT